MAFSLVSTGSKDDGFAPLDRQIDDTLGSKSHVERTSNQVHKKFMENVFSFAGFVKLPTPNIKEPEYDLCVKTGD